MNADTLDVVAAFKELRSALQTSGSGFRNGMHCYFWGRLSSFVIPAQAVTQGEDDAFRTSALALLRNERKIDPESLANDAEDRAKQVDAARSESLVIVGYWSNISYFFKHVASSNPEWSVYSADSFLSAIEDFADRHGAENLSAEMENLSNGLLAAQDATETEQAKKARLIIQWASSRNFGELLPAFAIEP